METGTIARLTDRGFGFIAQEGQDKDLFFHANELQGAEFNDLREGDAVTFEIADGPKGPNAVSVSKADGAATVATDDATDTAEEATEEVAEDTTKEEAAE